jgi:hypothetical protein
MATEFHLFVELPVELQLKIWKLSLPGPKAVFLKLVQRAVEPKPRFWKDIYFCSYSTPPAMLSACRISREVILSTHTAYIESSTCHSQRKIRLDPKIDTLLVIHGWLLPDTESDDNQSMSPFSDICRVALGEKDLRTANLLGNWVPVSKLFPKLEIFFVVYGDEQILECYKQGCEAIFTEDRDLLLRYSTLFGESESSIPTKIQRIRQSLEVGDGDGTSGKTI